MDTLPVPATDEMMLQLRRGRPYVSLDTDSVGGYVIRAAAPLDDSGSGSSRVLIALYPVPQQLSQLADTVQRSYTQYANLVQLRQPLKSTFVLILTFRRADVADRRGVRRVLRRAAPGAAGAGSDRRHARRGQGQLRHQAAAAVARRAGISRDLVQRHDQAAWGGRARKRAAASKRSRPSARDSR